MWLATAQATSSCIDAICSDFRNRRQNQFGSILETVIQGARVVITKRDSPKGVLISMDEFHALSNAHTVELETFSREFDGLLAEMQTPAARAGMKAAFHATPKHLGKAAVAVARKRA